MSPWWRRAPPEPEPGLPDWPAPGRTVAVVGDIHGCRDLLDDLLGRLADDPEGRAAELVFVGDYVDRGPDSAGVIDRLMALPGTWPAPVTCLAGNHDRMMMEFVDDPETGPGWLANGGMATLASLGVPHPPGTDMATRLAAQSAALGNRIGPAREAWLRARPLWWRSGTLVAVHALTDPDSPMEAQEPRTLMWARPGADLRPRADGAWVVHGHTIVHEPLIRQGHVAIDTGAVAGGALTAAIFRQGARPRFVTAGR